MNIQERVSTEQKEYENAMCKCGHPRKHHAGIDGFCYRSNCTCMVFTHLDIMSKEQKEYESDMCKCGNFRYYE